MFSYNVKYYESELCYKIALDVKLLFIKQELFLDITAG